MGAFDDLILLGGLCVGGYFGLKWLSGEAANAAGQITAPLGAADALANQTLNSPGPANGNGATFNLVAASSYVTPQANNQYQDSIVLQHRGQGGNFVFTFDMRNGGLLGAGVFGEGDWVTVGYGSFNVNQDASWETYSFSFGPWTGPDMTQNGLQGVAQGAQARVSITDPTGQNVYISDYTLPVGQP